MWITANIVMDTFTKTDSANFLIAYLAVLVLMGAGSWGLALMADDTTSDSTPDIPVDPDAYEIAYLRGGAKEVLRLVLFDLAGRGYLTLTTEESVFNNSYWVSQSDHAPPVSYLTSLEQQVVAQINKGTSIGDLLQDPNLLTIVDSHCATYEQHLVSNKLLLSSKTRAWLKGVRSACLTTIAIIGGVKLLIAQDMLLFVAIVTALTLAFGVLGSKLRRRTDKGQRYLDAFNDAFETMKINATQHRDLQATHGLLLGAIYGPSVMTQEELEEGPLF